mmetsp:Transcript_36115/g.53865  ORF Transcript_36115/g.53865 Transcript_36115/m.53865 type:complete len:221 (-) Transcript_36115:50-712(-)
MPTVFTKVIGSLKNILKYQTEAFRQYFSSLTNHQYCLCCFPTHPHCIKNQAFRKIHITTKTTTKRKHITRRVYTSAVGYLKRKHFYFFICFSSLLHICPHHPLPKIQRRTKCITSCMPPYEQYMHSYQLNFSFESIQQKIPIIFPFLLTPSSVVLWHLLQRRFDLFPNLIRRWNVDGRDIPWRLMQCGERNAGGHCQGHGRLLLCVSFQLLLVVVEEDCQ